MKVSKKSRIAVVNMERVGMFHASVVRAAAGVQEPGSQPRCNTVLMTTQLGQCNTLDQSYSPI